MAVSYFVLQGPRAQFSASIARRVDERARRAELGRTHDIDEVAEDTEAEGDSSGPWRPSAQVGGCPQPDRQQCAVEQLEPTRAG
jgi:hypothetical protein